MKRIIVLLVLILLSSSVVYADFDEGIGNHWSKGVIDEIFMEKYFPYLAENDFSRFKPNGPTTTDQFSKSIDLLFEHYNFETETILNNEDISREKMILILGNELENIGVKVDKNIGLPFKDINTMDQTNIDLLKMLYKLEIIKGETNSQFSPDRKLSQAEAIVILQRAKGVLNNMDKKISFKTLGVVQTFNGKEEITVIPQDEKVLVTITKQFPTPGYKIIVEDIVKIKEGYKINFNIEAPPRDSEQLQVITYKTISLEIDKDDLDQMPYNFILNGYNKN